MGEEFRGRSMRPAVRLQQHHRRGMSLSCALANDKDDDLVLFRDMQRKEQEKLSVPKVAVAQRSIMPLQASHHQPPYWMPMPRPVKSGAADDILSSDQDKNDYDWLMTPPSTPVFLNGDHDAGLSRRVSTTVRSSQLKPSKLRDSKSELPLKIESSPTSVDENCVLDLSLNKPFPGFITKSTRSSESALSLPRKPSAARSATQNSVHLSRLTSAGVTASKVSSSQSSARSTSASTSNGISQTMTSASHSASLSRPTTPVKRFSSPCHPNNPPSTLARCSSANRASSMIAQGALMSCKSSANVKAYSPDSLKGFSEESIVNHHTLAHGKSPSIFKGNKTNQKDVAHNGWKPGSSLVTKGPPAITSQNGVTGSHRTNQVDSRLAPKKGKLEEQVMGAKSAAVCLKEQQGSIVRKATKVNSFRDVKAIISSVRGSVPKKSSDLTATHDTGKSATNKFRSFMYNMARSTLMSRKPGRTASNPARLVLDSPMATSSTASSEQNMSIVIDPDGSELGDECTSERGSRLSSASQHDLALGREKRIHSWLRSPECKDDDTDIMQIFEQEGLGSLSGPESPLITELEGTIECDNFSLDPVL